MKKLSNKIAAFVVAILLFAMGSAFAFVNKHYELAIICVFIIAYISYKLYWLNIKTTNQFRLFTDSIKFSENNISFVNNISEDIYMDYYASLSSALKQINLKTQQRECDISFYNNLLNRIDFALIVIDRNGKIVWVNKYALDLLGRPKPLTIEHLKNISDELKKAFEELQPKSSRIVKLDNNGKLRSVILNLNEIVSEGNELRVYTLKDVQPVVEETEDAAWQELIGVLTHEIMNSLSPIISLSESLAKEEDNPKLLSQAMETIHRRSKGLVSFINNYKRIAQIPIPQCTRIEIKSMVDDVTSLMKRQGIELLTLITANNLILYADKRANRTSIDQFDKECTRILL